MRFCPAKQALDRFGLLRTFSAMAPRAAAAQPLRASAAAATLPVAAQQHPVPQYYGGCHNEDRFRSYASRAVPTGTVILSIQ